MTIERAIEILDPTHREHYDSIDVVNEACRLGMEALEKQIPKKPVTRGGVICHCPNCSGVLNDLVKYPYCDRCGQALDWSDNE